MKACERLINYGPYEHISVEGMEKSVEILLELIQEYVV